MSTQNNQLSTKEQLRVGLKTSLAGVTILLSYASLFLTIPIGYDALTNFSDGRNNSSIHNIVHLLLFSGTFRWDSINIIMVLSLFGVAFILGFILLALLVPLIVTLSAIKISKNFKSKTSKYNSFALKLVLVVNIAAITLVLFQTALGIFK